MLTQQNKKIKDFSSIVKVFSNRVTAAPIVSSELDTANGIRVIANEFGLVFIELGWETLDFAMLRDVYFRNIFQTFFAISVFFCNFEAR